MSTQLSSKNASTPEVDTSAATKDPPNETSATSNQELQDCLASGRANFVDAFGKLGAPAYDLVEEHLTPDAIEGHLADSVTGFLDKYSDQLPESSGDLDAEQIQQAYADMQTQLGDGIRASDLGERARCWVNENPEMSALLGAVGFIAADSDLAGSHSIDLSDKVTLDGALDMGSTLDLGYQRSELGITYANNGTTVGARGIHDVENDTYTLGGHIAHEADWGDVKVQGLGGTQGGEDLRSAGVALNWADENNTLAFSADHHQLGSAVTNQAELGFTNSGDNHTFTFNASALQSPETQTAGVDLSFAKDWKGGDLDLGAVHRIEDGVTTTELRGAANHTQGDNAYSFSGDYSQVGDVQSANALAKWVHSDGDETFTTTGTYNLADGFSSYGASLGYDKSTDDATLNALAQIATTPEGFSGSGTIAHATTLDNGFQRTLNGGLTFDQSGLGTLTGSMGLEDENTQMALELMHDFNGMSSLGGSFKTSDGPLSLNGFGSLNTEGGAKFGGGISYQPNENVHLYANGQFEKVGESRDASINLGAALKF